MDKKIAIVTWWQHRNYGGILQAYALQRILESWGYDSEFVDFLPERYDSSRKLSRLLKDIVILIARPTLCQARKKVSRFQEDNLKISSPYVTYGQLRDTAGGRYSAAICGSDQIWSNVGGYVNPLYYLTFIDEKKRIAYAPSIGYDSVPDCCIDAFGEYVTEIPFLSVREEQGARIVKDIAGREAKVVLDPSLLLTKEQWESEIQMRNEAYVEGNYILCYFLRDNPEYMKYARRLSSLTRHPILAMEPLSRKYTSSRGIQRVVADPFDFVNLIGNASYVLTDSFHGMAFSINFEKHFGVFERFRNDDPMSQNSRIHNLLQKTHLENQLITSATTPNGFVADEIDYCSVHSILDKEREQSLTYLKDSLTAVVGY